MAPVTLGEPIGKLAARLPAAAPVLRRHRIDYGCDGALSLSEACEKARVDPVWLIAEIAEACSGAAAGGPRWDQRPLDELIDHLIAAYHRPLADELSQLLAAVRALRATERGDRARQLDELIGALVVLEEEVGEHMAKEEQLLFPWIRSGSGRGSGVPVKLMHRDHRATAARLDRIRELIERLSPRRASSGRWRKLREQVARVDDLHREHIHLENNVLFPRALSE